MEETESSPKSGMSSPEAKLGMRVEDLWDMQEPQLSPTDKLNACFESIPVSSFPPAAPSQVIEINSDTSVADAVQLMAQHKILSVPVVDVDAPEDATWIDRYIGIIEFAGIVVWILHQSEKKEESVGSELDANGSKETMGPAVAAAANGMGSPRYRSSNPFSVASTSGNFFESLTSSEFYKNTKVNEDEPVLQAFKLMRQKGVGGVPVVESGGRKAVGNISISDIQFLLLASAIYKDHRSITAKNFLTAVRSYLEGNQQASPLLSGMVTCRRDDTLQEAITKLDSMKIHRIYVVDDAGNLESVITLRDIISKLVHEPHGYFGDFFDGVLPLPANSRV